MPIALKDAPKAELDQLVVKGVLSWLKEGKITELLSSGASFLIKPWGRMLLINDLVHLKRAIKRPFSLVKSSFLF